MDRKFEKCTLVFWALALDLFARVLTTRWRVQPARDSRRNYLERDFQEHLFSQLSAIIIDDYSQFNLTRNNTFLKPRDFERLLLI